MLERFAEMGDILEARLEDDIRHIHLISVSQKRGCIIETLLHDPTAGRLVKLFLEITFKGRKASVAQPRELLQGQTVTEIRFHDLMHGGSVAAGEVLKIARKTRIRFAQEDAYNQFLETDFGLATPEDSE